MANPKAHKRAQKGGTGRRKSKNPSNEEHSESETPQNLSQPSQSSRPKPVPNYKGTLAYEARHGSQAADVDAEEFDAATALIAFRGAKASEAETAPAHHVPAKNTIRVPPLKSKSKDITLSNMDKIFAWSMGMSEAEMIEQKEWEKEQGSNALMSSDVEDNTVPKPVKAPQKKKFAGTKSKEASIDVSGSEDESEPGMSSYYLSFRPLFILFFPFNRQ